MQQKLTQPCKSAMLRLKILCILNMCPQVRVDSISDEIMKLSFWGGPVVKNPPCNARDTGSVPSLGRSQTWQGNEARWASALEDMCNNYKSPRACTLQQDKPMQQERPSTAKISKYMYILKNSSNKMKVTRLICPLNPRKSLLSTTKSY